MNNLAQPSQTPCVLLQLQRIILYKRLLEAYPFQRQRIVREAKLDIPPLYRAHIWAALLDVQVTRHHNSSEHELSTLLHNASESQFSSLHASFSFCQRLQRGQEIGQLTRAFLFPMFAVMFYTEITPEWTFFKSQSSYSIQSQI